MSVDDYGIEVLKKAAEQVTPGSSADYYLKTRNTTAEAKLDQINTNLGAVNETAPATDTSSSGLNGRLQRIAQRLTTLIAFFASNFGSIANAIRVAAQLGDGAGTALTSTLVGTKQSLDTYLEQFRAATATHTRVTYTTANTAQQLIAANANRKWLIVVNRSGGNFFMNLGGTAVSNQGIPVENNSTYEMDGTKIFTGAISGVFTSNNRTIEVIEGT